MKLKTNKGSGNSKIAEPSDQSAEAMQKSAAKSQKIEKNSKSAIIFVLRSVIVMSVMLLVIYFIGLLSGFKPFFDTTAGGKAQLQMETDSAAADALMRQHLDNLTTVAAQLSHASDKAAIDKLLNRQVGSDKFGDLHYFVQDAEYSSSGIKLAYDFSSPFYKLSKRSQPACSDLFRNGTAGMDCIAFYVPVKGSDHVDGVMSVIPARNIIDLAPVRGENVAVSVLVSREGSVLSHTEEEGFLTRMQTNYLEFIKTFTQSKEARNKVQSLIQKDEAGTCQILSNGESYTVACAPLPSTDSHLRLVNLWVSSDLTVKEMNYIRQIIVISVIALLALLIALGFAFLFHARVTKMLLKASQTAPELGCANATQFRRRTGEILSASDSRCWYILCAEMRQYTYTVNQFGHDVALQQLKYIAKILESSCNGREFFGYAEDGVFHILLHCRDEAAFNNRLQVIIGLIGKSQLLKQQGVANGLYIGAYGVGTHRDLPVGEMLEYASTARTMAKSDIQKPYILYTDEIRNELMRNSQIEAQMEEALQNGEFKLFLQPKYGIHRDRVDSAEALVRWFDPRRNDYIFPVEFIPLFESNGFITKLDHFMYLEVCKYFKSAAERGSKVIPIAVNVSRVTAMRPDFLEFYIGNKEHYGIADGFLTVEMTESFAMENYDTIRQLVEQLHAHGIRCSIDDFGSGYSSFEVLKGIPVDELKMDRVFIADGIQTEKDEILIRSVIQLGKALGMRVVQEGVETKEIFDQICAMGADTIQGYYYARAIPLEEYRIFINSNTSIRYKAQVK